MNTVKIDGHPRETGKKATRAVRSAGRVPCVLYGHSADTVSFQVQATDLNHLVFTGERYRVEVNIGNESYDCILKDVDFHPVLHQPIHADFQLLRAGEKMRLSVPLKFVGKAKGQREGGDMQYLIHEVEAEAYPNDIPDHVEVDVSDLGIGDTIHVSDLRAEGVEFITAGNQSVVTCFIRKVELEPVVEAAEELLAEGEEVGEGVEAEAAEGAEETRTAEGEKKESE